MLQTTANESLGQFSPDGRWLAFQSDESGVPEIYVRPFPGQGRQRQVSVDGGTTPRWRRDGKELFYLASDARLMAVPIGLDLDGGAQMFESGTPVALFSTRLSYGTMLGLPIPNYAVAPDGQRFLMNVVSDRSTTSPITVVLNGFEALKAKGPPR